MKTTKTKKRSRVSISLDDYTADLLEQAWPMAQHGRRVDPGKLNRFEQYKYRNWFIGWALQAVSAAVVRAGAMPCPLGVTLTSEDPKDYATRIGENRDKRTFIVLEVDKSELAALEHFNKRNFKNKANVSHVAHSILRLVLAKPETTASLFDGYCRWRDAEGFTGSDDLAIQTKIIAGQRQYRSKASK